MHRDFGSAFPAKLIIERDKIYTENWNRTQRIGKLELDDFTPYPKNPILSKFFVNIGYADGLGSGVRNLYKFTKIYSGGEPDLEEGDIFRLTVPLINNSFENSAIGNENLAIAGKNLAIETEKLAIDGKKLVIGNENSSIKVNEKIIKKTNMAIEENKFSEPTRLRILLIYQKIGEGKVFGTSDIVQISGCSSSTARELLRKLRKMNVIEKVKGNGKGRYIFISE